MKKEQINHYLSPPRFIQILMLKRLRDEGWWISLGTLNFLYHS